MEQFKRAQVIMLSTKGKSNIGFYKDSKNTKLYLNSNLTPKTKLFPNWNPQHLHIISDDEIKKGDWYYNERLNKIFQAIANSGYNTVDKEFKIIATTDTSLKITKKTDNPALQRYISQGTVSSTYEESLPQPSQQFIKKYIEEYNKNNVIKDVLVEYHNNYDLHYYTPSGGIECCEKIDNWQLKINSKDNTITIKKVKDSYTREEIIEKMKLALQKGIYLEATVDLDFDENKWIEENL